MKSFLQSDEWRKFQQSLDRKVWRVDNVLIIQHNLPLSKKYLYSPRLSLSGFGGQARFEEWIDKIKEVAKNEKAIFLKLEPEDNIDKTILKEFKFKKSSNIQPQKTLILDITKSEQDLLKQMHQKTRYNIRLAEKKEIEVRTMNHESGIMNKNFEKFWKLLSNTAKRGKFQTHPRKYYEKMLKLPGIEMFLALYKNKIIAANIVLFWDKKAAYLHGASDYQYRNLMAPYLLQWRQILEAKKRGCTEYDFWGIDEKKWPGVTRFKKGFGGKEIEYPSAYDLVFQPIWYWIYKIAKKIL